MKRIMNAALLAVAIFLGSVASAAEVRPKIQLGAVENVVLLPWGVKMPARIDTGAALSSLDARNLTVKANIAEFQLPPRYGGLQLRLPILKWTTTRSAAASTRRPVVELQLCIGARRVRTRVNLTDRSRVEYPLLLGRNTIKHDFVVDCGTSYCTSPSCDGVTYQ